VAERVAAILQAEGCTEVKLSDYLLLAKQYTLTAA